MATQLDLQEQEQLDALKAFWNKQGNRITWLLVLVLGAVAAWFGWQNWQRDQSLKASAMFDELDKAVQAADVEKAGRVFADLKERFPGTAFAHQGGLMVAKSQFDKGQTDAAKASLQWVAQSGAPAELRAVAQLRLAAVQAEAKQFDEALKTLEGASAATGFEGLAADRRGDVLMLQGKKDDARSAYQAAYKALGNKLDYRRLVQAKLMALGADPEAPVAPATAAATAAAAVASTAAVPAASATAAVSAAAPAAASGASR